MNKRFIYDIEVYPNLFFLGAKVPGTEIRKSFEISPYKDNREELLQWVLALEEMVGFNNLYYDYPVLEYLFNTLFKMRGRDLTHRLWQFSSSLIKGKRFVNTRHHFRKQIDLFRINHFDNKSKKTSLKLLEFNLRMKNIQDLPYHPETVLTEEQINKVTSYCHNDVDATDTVYQETLPEIELREKMSSMFDIDFTNFNSTKMGEHILIKKIVESLGEHVVYDVRETSTGIKRKVKNTVRETIDFEEVVFDYIEFTTLPFQRILQWFKSRTIKETKGVFSNIPIEELELIEGFYDTSELKWDDDKQEMRIKPLINTKNELETLNIRNFDFRYDYGVGGIHGSIVSGIYEETETQEIRDIDVASYYPNLGIENGFYPEHLGVEFCDIYKSIYEERKKYPKKTHKMENLALKLALNGSYGKSNSQYSPLYDPMYAMKTTVNGQLLLCMLSEQLMTRVPDCLMLQINTDGMTVKYDRVYSELVNDICSEWEQLTKLTLEHAYYTKMVIKDVNNYLAVSTEGWIKRKGAAFIYKQAPGELELHKNFSHLVVPKAIEAYFVDGVVPEDFIQNHDDIFDFFKRTKLDRNYKLLSTKINESGNIIESSELQRITRYLITGEIIERDKKYYPIGYGTVLMKQMPAIPSKVEKILAENTELTRKEVEEQLIRLNNIESGYMCVPFNEITDTDVIRQYIYYPYYIREVYKVIKQIEHVHSLS